ncbi:hypothetical protein CKAH01_00640 [Colletotrichum kahawae]|uniref:Uncharacterized protein n=1 Tax=Colletotrichum kahawae TaxID=34407 RepID=A0AAD9YHB8_COLKA|nr:hypothetical protein CKAH01_00640 [Colletotrichum kahawae]
MTSSLQPWRTMKPPDPKHMRVYWGQGTLNAAWLLAASRRRGVPVKLPALSAGAAPPQSLSLSLSSGGGGLPTLLPTSADDPCHRQRLTGYPAISAQDVIRPPTWVCMAFPRGVNFERRKSEEQQEVLARAYTAETAPTK